MNILITGANGFIGKNAVKHFRQKGYNVYTATSDTLNLFNAHQVDDFFENIAIDYVLHTAIKGGRRIKTDRPDLVYQNLLMLNNLIKHVDKYKLLISIGSGAEFDRRRDIYKFKEEQFGQSVPVDYYGLSKYLIATQIQNTKLTNLVNFRVFNCFGEDEAEGRMVSNSIKCCIESQNISVHQDRYLDFFYIKDLYKVVEYYIKNTNKELPRDINLCYTDKTRLTDIARKIINLTNSEVAVTLGYGAMAHSYCGDGTLLSELNIPFIGLEQGLQNTINYYLERDE
jgi:nucleoside-diphosphate-sugar epimerase